LAADSGHDVRYFGSYRGQEGKAAEDAGLQFSGTEAGPIPKLASIQGLQAVLTLFRSAKQVAAEFHQWRPDVLFATGGYSSGPALRAARSMRIPIVLHEQNAVPGRATKSMANAAAKVCIVFEKTSTYFPNEKIVVTGMPVRWQLVDAAGTHRPRTEFATLVTGGSQGARALNEAATHAAAGSGEAWLHITGNQLFDEVADKSNSNNYRVVPFLDANEMAQALSMSSLAIVRAGCGTIAELALFGIPAIYVPLPSSFANHQMYNAQEIERIGGGSILDQAQLTPKSLRSAWQAWRDDEPRRVTAAAALRHWSKPEAGQAVFDVIKGVAS